MAQLFISHATEDAEAATAFLEELESAGVSCWIAPRDIAPGEIWADAISAAIREATAVLFVVSSAAMQSRHVIREAERADRAQRALIPVLVDNVEVTGALGYYFGSAQWIRAYSSPGYSQPTHAIQSILEALGRPTPRETMKDETSDADLEGLARSICADIRPGLVGTPSPEDLTTIAEPALGNQVKLIDLAANKEARKTVNEWSRRFGVAVHLVGEDIEKIGLPPGDEPIVVLLDSLDGTQHWLRRKNLWCTALSIFRRNSEGRYELRVSAVQQADGTIAIAREDTASVYVDGTPSRIQVTSQPTPMDRAHVCTVIRRPSHYEVLRPLLSLGIPFNGLYSFGGNPILVDVALGTYDATFQPDASVVDEALHLWDWLPGGHVAARAGCTVVDLAGEPIDVPLAAERALTEGSRSTGFVVAADPGLARDIIAWISNQGLALTDR